MADPANMQPIFVDMSTARGPFPLVFPSNATSAKEAAPVEVKSEKDEQQEKGAIKASKPPEENLEEESEDEPTPPAKAVTGSAERFKCTECNRYSAESEEQLQRHVRKMHLGQNPFQCYMCDYSTYNKPLFEEHVRIHRGIKPFKCQHCPYRSASKKNAKKHEKIHRPNNPLKCPVCPFIGRHVRSLNHHRQQHNRSSAEEMYKKLKEQEDAREAAAFVCEHCGTDFAVARNLASHQRNVKKCEDCDALLCSKFLYKRHLTTIHSRSPEAEATFRCALCPWRGSHRPRVLLHLIHHPQQVDESVLDVGILRTYGIIP